MFNKPKAVQPADLEETLSGVCHVCGTVVSEVRWKAHPPRWAGSDGAVTAWDEQYTAECPTCRERSPSKSGTRVYLTKNRGAGNAG